MTENKESLKDVNRRNILTKTAYVAAGSGGSGADMPAFIRVSRDI